MKKMNIAAVIAAMTVATAAMAVPAMAQAGEITEAQAKQIALTDAGLAEKDVVFVRSNPDFDDGMKQYEVEFYCGNMEYDYDIDASTGAILSVDWDCEFYAPVVQETAAASGSLTKEEAIAAALDYAGVDENSVSYVQATPDLDDGRQVYEVKFYVGMTEFSCDVDMNSGTIFDFEMDIDD